MKVAVCLSGQPRSFEKGYEYLKKNVLDHYDADIFYHTWKYDEQLTSQIESLYKPTDCLYEEPLSEQYFKETYPTPNPQYPPYNTTQMFYSIFMANHVKTKYSLTNNVKYDIVIKSRFDFAINKTFDFSDVEEYKVYVPNCRQDESHTICNDQFAYGKPKAINLYSLTFQMIDLLVDQEYPYNGEELLAGTLSEVGLIGKNMVYVDVNHPFMPDRYGSMRHSLIRDDFSQWNKLRG